MDLSRVYLVLKFHSHRMAILTFRLCNKNEKKGKRAGNRNHRQLSAVYHYMHILIRDFPRAIIFIPRHVVTEKLNIISEMFNLSGHIVRNIER